MTQRAILEMTEGDNDSFLVTLTGVNLVGADYFRIRMRRPTTVLEKDGTDIGNLALGQFSIIFDSATDLVKGDQQAVDIKWSIGGVVLTAKEQLFINVKEAI